MIKNTYLKKMIQNLKIDIHNKFILFNKYKLIITPKHNLKFSFFL